MRKGNNASLVFDRKGHLVAIATGSDATSEHEGGSRELMQDLCEQYAFEARSLLALKEGRPTPPVRFLDIKTISRFPSGLKFEEVPASIGRQAEAMLRYSPNEYALVQYKSELAFPSSKVGVSDMDVVGAWDSRSFALRVRGDKYVKALKDFYRAVLAKKVLFASTFFHRKQYPQLNGVVLVNLEHLRPEDYVSMAEAEAKYVKSLRLKALDKSSDITRQVHELLGCSTLGSISPYSFDENSLSVSYWFNPSRNLNAECGSYTSEAILEWAKAKGRYRLANLL